MVFQEQKQGKICNLCEKMTRCGGHKYTTEPALHHCYRIFDTSSPSRSRSFVYQ